MSFEETIYRNSPVWARTVLMNAHGLRIHRHRYGSEYRNLLSLFERLATASVDAMAQFRSERLKIVFQAASRSPFYRERLAAAGLGPTDYAHPEALNRLPVLTKQELRDKLPNILTSKTPQRGWLHGHTSGTTGSPLSLWYDRTTCAATNAGDRLQKRWAGIADSEWVGLLLGRQVVPIDERSGPFWQPNYVQRQLWFSSLHMSPETLPTYVREIRRRGLTAIEGYPSTLYVLARFLLDRGERLPMRAAFSSSETLHRTQREAIEQAFEAPLFDFYGHAERAIFAIECSHHKGKHLVEPFGFTEVVDADDKVVPDGTPGFLVGTSLFNTAMPLLRYRTGDISAIDRSPCPCGSAFPRIVGVSTKAEDIVVLPDGRWLSPSALTHPFKPFPEIRESQLVQESAHLVRVRITAGDDFDKLKEGQFLAGLQARLGPDVTIELERVGEIARERSGKFRWVVSKVPHSVQIDWSADDHEGDTA